MKRTVLIGLSLLLASGIDAAAQQTPEAPPAPALRRWLEFDFAQIGTRYRVVENSTGRVTANQLQHREQFRARFKFDPRGRYAVHAGLFTGSAFTSGWNNTGVGTGDAVTNLRLKQLFAAATPIDGVQFQVGSLYVNRGEHTEITTYDDDAYITGTRAQVTRPKQLWFDELTFTQARIDNLTQPSVTHRWDDLGNPNYRQFLARRKLGRVAMSADYTTLEGAHTVRAAAAVSTAPALVRIEAYRRVHEQPDGGFAVAVERAITSRARLSGGYTTIDWDYGGLNGDRYDRGRRLFGTLNVAFTRSLSLQLFATRGIANDRPMPNRTRFDAVLTYNLLPALQRSGLF